MAPSVPINQSNLWRLANTNFLKKIDKIGRTRRYDFVINDLVKVIGGKESGKIGRIRRIIPELDQIIVEGVHTRIQTITKQNNEKIHLLIDRAIPTEYVQLIHPKSFNPIRVEGMTINSGFGYKKFTRFILPEKQEELSFPRIRGLHSAGSKDTPVDQAFKVTYQPDLNNNPLPYGCFI